MRNKNKLSCDFCGNFIRELTKKEMKKIMKERAEGTRTNCSAFCGKCKYKTLYGRNPK